MAKKFKTTKKRIPLRKKKVTYSHFNPEEHKIETKMASVKTGSHCIGSPDKVDYCSCKKFKPKKGSGDYTITDVFKVKDNPENFHKVAFGEKKGCGKYFNTKMKCGTFMQLCPACSLRPTRSGDKK